MRSGIFEGSPKKKIYWSYKFENESFSNALREELEILEGDTYGEFERKLTNVSNAHAPIKTKMRRFNNNVFMTKVLRKDIMKRSKLNLIETKIMKTGAIQISEELLCKTFKENEKTALCKIKCQEYNGQPNFLENHKNIFQR